ncbi:hypothetical protein CRYUN_Cryun37aG0078500 [Craigia yunnanensis]
MSEVESVEDALLVKKVGGKKVNPLRGKWGDWFDKKGDILRRDMMFKSNLEVLNQLNNPLLQDPDGVGVTGLTRESGSSSKDLSSSTNGNESRSRKNEVKNVDLEADKSNTEFAGHIYADGKRWGYYPGLDSRLSFSDFMDAFFRKGKCDMRVFMIWNSPPWMYSVRHQRGLESLLAQHRDACVVVFSETIELDFFKDSFVKDGYKVAVAMPNLDELLKETPTHIYSELVRLAALYKYGGIYLDSDIIVLKPLLALNNSVGLEDQLAGSSLNGALMAFRKQRYFVAPTETEKTQQDALFNKILTEFVTFHFWNSLTSALIPQPESLVIRLIDHPCIHCSELL